MSDKHKCAYHQCKDCSGGGKIISLLVFAIGIESLIVMCASGVLHPLFGWLPHFDYTQALALSLLLGFVTQVRVKGIMSSA